MSALVIAIACIRSAIFLYGTRKRLYASWSGWLRQAYGQSLLERCPLMARVLAALTLILSGQQRKDSTQLSAFTWLCTEIIWGTTGIWIVVLASCFSA